MKGLVTVVLLAVLQVASAAGGTQQNLGDRILRANDELLNKGNVAIAREIFAPDYVGHETNGDVRGGPEIIERYVTELRAAFPDLRVEVKVLVTQGDRVAWIRTHRGTQKAEFMGVPASGRVVIWQEMVVSRFENGKIVEEWGVSDLGERLRTR